jgi:iron complex transport system ATP-binding protein
VLHVENLVIRRGRTRILRGIDWTVRRGEHWVILGPNGSGKTSLLSALTGYLTPTEGRMVLLGEEYGQTDWRALRSRIGLVSSSIRQMMPDHEPAWITVASGRYAMIDFWGNPSSRERQAALRLLRQVECPAVADRPWLYLSQGERQRVLIGRALMAHPQLLILDEPCAGLDPAAREQFLHFLQRLGRRRGGPSLVLVTHHVEEIMPVFNRGLVLLEGRTLAAGPTARVMRDGVLSQAFGMRTVVRRDRGRYAVRLHPRIPRVA